MTPMRRARKDLSDTLTPSTPEDSRALDDDDVPATREEFRKMSRQMRDMKRFVQDVMSQQSEDAEAVQKDLEHDNPGWGRSELFVEAGRYAVQLERWLRVYPAGQIKVLLHEDLASEATWKDLAEWLDLDGEIPESGTERVNPAGLPRWEGVNRWLTSTGLKGPMSGWMPARVKASLRSKWYSSEDMPRLQPDERRILFRNFEQDVAVLERLIGRDLAQWRP